MHQIFYLTVDPERALGVEDLLPSYHILHCDISQLSEPISHRGIDIQHFELENSQNTSKLLESIKVQKYINKNAVGKPDILVFKNEKKIEELCQQLDYNLLNPDAALAKKFENKLDFANYIKDIDIFTKPQYESFEKLSDLNYELLSQNLHNQLVIQFMFGHSGNSTFYVNNAEELKELQDKYPLRQGKVAKKIDGIPYTINACITQLGVVVGGISEQITGFEELTSSPGGTVGNDFTQRHLTDKLRKELIEKTMEFGEILKEEGFRGIFGLDLVLDSEGDEFYIIEANTRQTMSCSYVSYLQRCNQIMPIMLWHILELLGHDFSKEFVCMGEEDEAWINKCITEFRDGDALAYNIKTNQPINASQIFFRNIKDQDVKVADPFPSGIYRMRGRLPNESAALEDDTKYSAIYRLREDGWSSLCFIKRGYNIIEAQEERGFFIAAAAEGAIIPPFGEIGRLQILDTAFSSTTSDELSGWIKDTISVVYENMSLSNA